ncbi:zinc-binding alcohol dehydrogenase family protein [Spirosoma sp. BT702]|uniref:Zinc-binding alcohol dehydrogenase family protein n=1 Tax=Spirosoma profusum TaxID=2771354 RepID=A0A927ASZ0_9BACT|nr:zinc-binding alcohol dehydrogenase family protein [Spirosoma profusum]MBD2702015.1 zinc-binding alcohol dehydrogenase family protein [Spirosoma profusum]
MKAAVIHQFGEVPRYEDITDPVPQNEQELVMTVKAASLKNIDKGQANGSHYDSHKKFPAVVGTDGVGVLPDGSRVFTFFSGATMAEKAIVQKGSFVPLPDTIDDVTAAALPNPGLSAWFSLVTRAGLQPGETVLINGATGITGKTAIQLAKQLGAGKIIVTGRNAQNLAMLPELGADVTISLLQSDDDLRTAFKEEFKKSPINVVIDYTWGHPAEILLSALTGNDLMAVAHRTRYVTVGSMAGPTIQLASDTLRSAAIELYGVGGGSIPKEVMQKIPTEILPQLFDLVATGKLKLDTEAVPLSEVSSAWERSGTAGKRYVLVP